MRSAAVSFPVQIEPSTYDMDEINEDLEEILDFDINDLFDFE